MKIYTRKGDDGTTGLLYGGRVRKDDPAPAAYGDVDEAQSALGVARAIGRAHAGPTSQELDTVLIGVERDLWVLMAELATDDPNRAKLETGTSKVSAQMIIALEQLIDDFTDRFDMPKEFVVPGQNVVAAHLDLARTVVRRAERSAIAVAAADSLVVSYLNRLSDLVWTLARWQEQGASMPTRLERRAPLPGNSN